MNQQQFILEYALFSGFIIMSDIFQTFLELRFFEKFSDKKAKVWHYVIFILLSLVISAFEFKLQPVALSPVFLILRTALLWGYGAAFLKCPLAVSLLSAIVAKTVTLLSAGITASVTFLIASAATQMIFGETIAGGIGLGLLGQIFTFLLIIVSYQIILRGFKWQGALPNHYLAVFFLPVLLVLIIEQYIFNQVYGSEVIIESVQIVGSAEVIESAEIIKPDANHWQLFFIQLFACFTLFSTLYACRRLTEDFANRTRLLMLERETAVQRDYLEETRARYEQTRSFRHDIKHHLLTIAGLLEQGEARKAKEYLGKLEGVSEALSFPCKTGNTVVDTVLGSKLSIALQNKIQVECTVKLPSPCFADNLDLCILFANAVDNAIHACIEQEEGTRFIRISSRKKGSFFMVEFENSCRSDGTYKKGIGLNNIEAVSEKYHGAVTAKKQGNRFCLNVLLIISGQLDDI